MLLPHRYAIGCEDRLNLICRQDMVWDKRNCMPESVSDRTRNTHEYWFHLTKDEDYYSNMDSIRVPDDDDNPSGAIPGSVWSIPSEALRLPAWLDVEHWAAFPTEWPRRIILGWSPPGICLECDEPRKAVTRKELVQTGEAHRAGAAKRDLRNPHGTTNGFNRDGYPTGYYKVDILGYDCPCTPAIDMVVPANQPPTRPAVVLDPFGGTGTTAMVARALGRYGLSVDLSGDYLRLANWRIWESPTIGKVLSRTDKERQGSLAI
jgi:hypothetical protein